MRSRYSALAFLATGLGCATVVPIQTASVVPEDSWRVGGQLSAAAVCSPGDLFSCHAPFDGIPLPEVQVGARRGLGAAADLGASLRLNGAVLAATRPLQIGLSLDGRRELLRRPSAEGRQHILSLGLQLSGAVAGRFGLSPQLQTELALPLHYGFQTPRFEWVVGASLSRRVTWASGADRVDPSALFSWRTGASFGLFRRVAPLWAVQLGVLAEPIRPQAGALLLQLGWFWESAAREGAIGP